MKRFASSGSTDSQSSRLRFTSRATLTGTLLIGLLLSLAACNDYYHHGKYEMLVSGGDLFFTVCEGQVATDILVQEWHRGMGEPSDETIWHAEGEADLRAGTVLQAGTDSDGLSTVEFAMPALEPGTKYFIEVQGDVPGTPSALLEIPADGMPNGMWLNSDGRVRERACSG